MKGNYQLQSFPPSSSNFCLFRLLWKQSNNREEGVVSVFFTQNNIFLTLAWLVRCRIGPCWQWTAKPRHLILAFRTFGLKSTNKLAHSRKNDNCQLTAEPSVCWSGCVCLLKKKVFFLLPRSDLAVETLVHGGKHLLGILVRRTLPKPDVSSYWANYGSTIWQGGI